MIFCVPCFLTIRTVTVLLVLGIAYKEASAVVAAYHNSFRSLILFTEILQCGIFRHHPCQYIPCYIEHGIHISGEHKPVVLRIDFQTQLEIRDAVNQSFTQLFIFIADFFQGLQNP